MIAKDREGASGHMYALYTLSVIQSSKENEVEEVVLRDKNHMAENKSVCGGEPKS